MRTMAKKTSSVDNIGEINLKLFEANFSMAWFLQMQGKTMNPHFVWGEVFFGVSIAAAVIAGYRRRSQREDGYESIVV